VLLLGALLAEARAAGALRPMPTAPLPRALRAEVKTVAEAVGGGGVDERTMARALIAWTEVFGAISFELFGRINNAIDERTAWYDFQMRAMLAFIGIGE
jgi:hypothetical protein